MKEDTLWAADPHTLAKLRILRSYLGAWMPIVTKIPAPHGYVRYIDGFAGPGVYAGGEPGSPIVALDVALGHSRQFSRPVKMTFIEEREDRVEVLDRQLEHRKVEVERSDQVLSARIEQGDCEIVLTSFLDVAQQRGLSFGPALVFLDQFGYSLVSMNLITRLMAQQVTEVFVYIGWKNINRFITDPAKAESLTRAFGSTNWERAVGLPPQERERYLLGLYKGTLRSRAGAGCVCHFSMYDHHDQLLYWLFFASNNDKGLEMMKRSMWEVDRTGEFKYSDKHLDSPILLAGYDDEWLAQELLRCFAGATLSIEEIWDYVLKETPCYRYNHALALLEERDLIHLPNAPAGRRKRSFAKYNGHNRLRVSFREA